MATMYTAKELTTRLELAEAALTAASAAVKRAKQKVESAAQRKERMLTVHLESTEAHSDALLEMDQLAQAESDRMSEVNKLRDQLALMKNQKTSGVTS